MNIKQAIEVYATADEESGYEHRSYGACIGVLDGVVAIADEDGENGSSLKMYRSDKFIAWMEAARSGVASGLFDDIHEAVNETRIAPEYSEGH